MQADRDKKLSKYLSKLLRHQPERIGIELSIDGWVDVDALLGGCRANGVAIERDDLIRIATSPTNRRYELDAAGQPVRARYGHSVPLAGRRVANPPPTLLFHGTADFNVEGILNDGIVPMGREMVHLSTTREQAERVGRRHGRAIVLSIDAAGAATAGAEFYEMSETVWQTDWVEPTFISVADS